MKLFTLGDSHSIYSFAGLEQARIFHCGPVTMHRAARDGIASLVPKNCRPKEGDFIILSFGEIDSRMHVKKRALSIGLPLETIIDDLCLRFHEALKRFRQACHATVSLSCIVPFNPDFADYGTDDDRATRIIEERTIRSRMNLRMSEMDVPFIDFHSHFANEDGSILEEMSDGACHIDSRRSKPVADAVSSTLGIEVTFIAPAWPPKRRAEPYYMSYAQWGKAIARTPEKHVLRPLIRSVRKRVLSSA